jgi:hypothetical protein
MPLLVIAAYHCEVAGEPTDSVDYKVRYFESDFIDEVASRLRAEPPQTYMNSAGEEVRWIFDGTVAVETDPVFTDGVEVIGFITGKPRQITESGARPNDDSAIAPSS